MAYKNQKEMFRAIWESRPRVSEISGKPLIQNPNDFHFYWQFAHIIGKGAYPRFNLLEENIILMTWKEHEEQTNGRYKETWTPDQIEIFESKRLRLIQKYYE